MEKNSGVRFAPFSLTALVVLLDQASKAAVVASIPWAPGRPGVGAVWFDGLVRLIHTRNPGIAFSIGRGLPEAARLGLFTLLPLAVLAGLAWYYFRTEELTRLQRWALAGILGGGAGNLIDRIMRPEGVVDFIDMAFFGILGLERWPTYNLADATVVVCGVLLAVTLLFQKKGSNP